MKKYHQLLLLILSVVSLSLFLVYRHEYNRLHYVLEVFNFFGTPCNFSNLQETNTILTQHDWGPIPAWQEIDGGSYIYSAYWNNNEVKALAYAPAETNIPRSCYVWFEDEEKPIIGKFKYSNVHPENDKASKTAFHYSCSVSSMKYVPYAVSFVGKNKRALTSLVKTPIVKRNNLRIIFNTTLCVTPSSNFSKKNLLEFLSYHKLIGIDSFIFYNDNIPYRLVKLLINVSSRLGYKITFLPWNIPKSSNEQFSRAFTENDCILRTLNESKSVITLDISEYIVPTKYFSFNEILTDFNGQSEILSLPVQYFCINYNNPKQPTALQNIRVSKNKNNQVYNIYRHVQDSSVVNTQILDTGFASIHKYIHCTTDTKSYSYNDNTILKYSKDLIRSTLVQLLIHDQI